MIFVALLLAVGEPTVLDQIVSSTRARVAAQDRWDDCVQRMSHRYARRPEKAAVVADAVLGSCYSDEVDVEMKTLTSHHLTERLDGSELRDEVEDTMSRWREVERQTALAIVFKSR